MSGFHNLISDYLPCVQRKKGSTISVMAEAKIFFKLDVDGDGYPPVAVESVWARSGEKAGEYIIDNIPFFTKEATDGDVVAASQDDKGNLWFHEVLRPSRNSLIRVIFFVTDQLESVREHLIALGCATEYFGTYGLLSVSVPAQIDLSSIEQYLDEHRESGAIDYEGAILWDQSRPQDPVV